MENIEKARVIEIIQSTLPELRGKYKMKSISLFGSVARGDANPQSDVDLLVDLEEGADLFDLAGIGNALEEKLKRRVDIVPRNGLRKELKERIEKEAVII